MLRSLWPVLILSLTTVTAPPSAAATAELRTATLAAFERYIAATEAQQARDEHRLWVDGDGTEARAARDALRRGALAITPLDTRPAGRAVPIPGGMVHHWLGVVFVPHATLDQAVTLLQAYDRHAAVYGPHVARSRLVARNGDRFLVDLRFRMRKIITVVVNSTHEARFVRLGPADVRSRVASTRIAEVDEADTPREREKPVGRDSGYLWRLHSYWRLAERDGGVYVQCESISLTRDIPFAVAWLIRPMVDSLPRETLAFTLDTTRRALQRPPA